MITLSLLKLLENKGFGTIDEDLFFQKLTLNEDGIYIADIGDSNQRGSRNSQSFELFSRDANDVNGYKKLVEIRDFLIDNDICDLPAVPPITSKAYTNITLMRPSTITNVGMDSLKRVIYTMTGTILFNR